MQFCFNRPKMNHYNKNIPTPPLVHSLNSKGNIIILQIEIPTLSVDQVNHSTTATPGDLWLGPFAKESHWLSKRLTGTLYRRLQSCTAANPYNRVICLLGDLYTMWTQNRVPICSHLYRRKQDGGPSIYNLSRHSGPKEKLMWAAIVCYCKKHSM